MTRRNGTAVYRRFGVRDAAFRAGDLAAAVRRAGGFGVLAAAVLRAVEAGAARRAGRVGGVADAAPFRPPLAAAAFATAAFGAGLGAGWDFWTVSAARAFSAAGDRCTSAKRIWSPTD